jgi:hypothetical protein
MNCGLAKTGKKTFSTASAILFAPFGRNRRAPNGARVSLRIYFGRLSLPPQAGTLRLAEQAGIRGVKYANCTGDLICALRAQQIARRFFRDCKEEF